MHRQRQGQETLRVRREGQCRCHAQTGLDGGSAQLHGQPIRRPHVERAVGAGHHPDRGHWGQAQAGGRRPGLQGRGCGQPWRSDHPPGQAQEPDHPAATLAQTQAGSGAGHRAFEA